ADIICMYAKPNQDDMASYKYKFLWVKHLTVECERKGILKMLSICSKKLNRETKKREELPGERKAVNLLSNRNSKLISLNDKILQQFLHFKHEHPVFPCSTGHYSEYTCSTGHYLETLAPRNIVKPFLHRDYTKMKHEVLNLLKVRAWADWLNFSNRLWIREAAEKDWLNFLTENAKEFN
ncbi:MAG: hypothetical protein ACOYNN_17075, partial [Terrimicrobiaceae bacterium]